MQANQTFGVSGVDEVDNLSATCNCDENISGNSVQLYKRFCQEASCKPNSGFVSFLQERGCTLRLETLSFTSNYFGPQGLLPIIRLIERCQTLVKIDLENNGADNEAVGRLCDVLETHLGVSWISLKGNPITQKGGRRILQLVENNPRIVYIDISGTNIYESVQEAIYCTVKKHCERLRHCTDLMPSDSSTKKLAKELVSQLPPIRQKKEHVAVRPISRVSHVREQGGTMSFSGARGPGSGEMIGSCYMGSTVSPQIQHGGNGGANSYSVFRNSGGDEIEYLRPTKEDEEYKKHMGKNSANAFFSNDPLLPQELQKIRAQFTERARFFGSLQRNEISSVANQTRLELMLVERNATNLPFLSAPGSLGSFPSLKNKAKDGASSYADAEDRHGEKDFFKKEGRSKLIDSNSTETLKESKVRNLANNNENKVNISSTRVSERGGEDRKTFSINDDRAQAAFESLVCGTKDRPICPTLGEVSHLAHNLPVSGEQQFQALFDQGCREYQHQQLDRAYVAWNEAMSVAVQHKNQEWIAVLTTNLQHITYEIFVKDGKAKLENGMLEDADHCFERGLHIAATAKNAKWHSEMVRARQAVKCGEFYKHHKVALELFLGARQLTDRHVTSDDYYLIPKSLTGNHEQLGVGDNPRQFREDSSDLSEGIKVQHTEAFVNEWPRIHLVEEAIQTWVEAAKVARKVSPAARAALLETLNVALNAVSVFLIQLHFDRAEPHGAVSWQGTSRFTFHECVKLSELYINMIGHNQQHIHHDLLGFVIDLYVGNLAVATYDLTHAQQHFNAALRVSKKMNVEVLEATALTFSATVNIQRANYAVAERELLEARRYWEKSINQEKTAACPERGQQVDKARSPSVAELPGGDEGSKELLAGASCPYGANGVARSKEHHLNEKSVSKRSDPTCPSRVHSALGTGAGRIQEALDANPCRIRSSSTHSPGGESVTSSGLTSGGVIDGESGESPSLLYNSAPGFTPRFSTVREAVQFAIPSRYATVMEHAGNNKLVTILTSTYRYQDALETLEYSLRHQHQDLLLDKMHMNFSDCPTLGQLMGVASVTRSNLVYYFISHRYNWSAERNTYEMEESLLMWVVPHCSDGEMHFVEINVTKEYHTTIESLVQTARTGMLVGNRGTPGNKNLVDGVVLTTNRKAWITPLKSLYNVFLDPIASYMWTLEQPLDMGHSVITIIPSGSLWIVPFNALISPHGRYAIEDFAIQLAFCATQAHFATVSVERVRERNLQRSVIVQQMELPFSTLNDVGAAASMTSPSHLTPTAVLPEENEEECDCIRSSLEVQAILEAIRDEKEGQAAAFRNKNSQVSMNPRLSAEQEKNVICSSQLGGVIIAPSAEVVEDLESTISLMPRSRTLHFATQTSYGSPLGESDGAVGEIKIAVCATEETAARMSSLRASEISRMELFAEIVTLSNTNIGLNERGEVVQDSLGLARAFLSAGAPCVVVSQWCTPDIYPAAVFATLYSKIYQCTHPVTVIRHRQGSLENEQDYRRAKNSPIEIISTQQETYSVAETSSAPRDAVAEFSSLSISKKNERENIPALSETSREQLPSSLPGVGAVSCGHPQSGESDYKRIPNEGGSCNSQKYRAVTGKKNEPYESQRHKANHLAESVRELLHDPSMRYCPRAWAGYYCIGSGFF